jgi:hypothetical protein
MAIAGNVLRIAGTALFTLLLLTPFSSGSHVLPLHEGPQLRALGADALERWLRPDVLYADTELLARYYVEDQMVATLVKLRTANLEPDRKAALQADALAVWTKAQQGYDAVNLFYHSVLPPPEGAVCISLETQAWALRATRALLGAGLGDAGLLSRRATEAKDTVLDLLELQAHRGRPPCAPQVIQQPMAVIALLEQRGPNPDARIDAVVPPVVNGLRSLFTDDAYAVDGFYGIEVNAKLLWMLTDAAATYPGLGATRDRLLRFLLNETLEPVSAGYAVHHVRSLGDELVQDGQGNALNQLWLAIALTHHAQTIPGQVPAGRVAGILNVLLSDYWSRDKGAFMNPNELRSFEPNALAALFANAPFVQSLATENSEFALAVPATGTYQYGAVDPALLASQWHLRFQLSGDSAGTTDVLLSSGDLGSYNFTASNPLRLFRSPPGGTRIPIDNYRVEAGPVQALRFSVDLTTAPANYRLEGAAPLRPVASLFENRIQLLVDNPGSDAFELRSLRLEISATEIDVRSVKVNGNAVPRERYEVIAPVTTQEVQEPHTRLIVSDVVFAPGNSEIVIEYDDRKAPVIDAPTISHDADGRELVRAAPTGTALQGEPLYVRAVVRDNGVLRNVLLRFQSQSDPREVVETAMTEGDNGVYTARIPNTNRTGVMRIQVVAIDAASNLQQTGPLFVDISNPLLSGSRVLFAFSGTLFVSAFIIWAKVRRKAA